MPTKKKGLGPQKFLGDLIDDPQNPFRGNCCVLAGIIVLRALTLQSFKPRAFPNWMSPNDGRITADDQGV